MIYLDSFACRSLTVRFRLMSSIASFISIYQCGRSKVYRVRATRPHASFTTVLLCFALTTLPFSQNHCRRSPNIDNNTYFNCLYCNSRAWCCHYGTLDDFTTMTTQTRLRSLSCGLESRRIDTVLNYSRQVNEVVCGHVAHGNDVKSAS